ncbi:diaminobutyrate--2-oxoglutarate transaminase [Yersinia pseudotuberculosis]|uniref:Diaminobutyrate--2-oxoglutarate transaminase n=1 Tax=Yersinia pseudotuberculosis TaxID=633 RepID=Q6EVQ9_YERPU|nr:diaminobutyrate--2-oxoglutarate transaminase [Yersinia pseudotuberculosis]AYW90809.1 diaminobutyrate--2-oxoglutarate transaminase [Yersinia pseudotuberculosis]MBO1632074.1 diaminobutyrate--2-oxoglutarate transaminase [Yersinia pseudotuberculosis]MBP0071745.1 diaminobutyrate--2-oxoglutarate transaminase [Yersinia pseudotuberculosis]CAF28549.1 putative diaminobutyrate transaminase [Yersinia pseudotuberculosis]CNE55782.1 4-aminobutyrate aminotransferase [Yersinia pseudotuberculosis]
MTTLENNNTLNVFSDHESSARSYCRNFPVIFQRASGCYLYDQHDNAWLDFLSCAGSVNYGHNPTALKEALIAYLAADGIQAALDMHSVAKAEFITAFNAIILQPRGLDYKMQFTSPTGTSVVESAIKLVRKVTNRTNVVAFTNGFHGMSSTALGLTGNRDNRQNTIDSHVFRLPYDGYLEGLDTIAYFEKLLTDNSSGMDIPAAVILETVQGEGGINVASKTWLQRLHTLLQRHDILLIIDDIQAGCGRTGHFFSFEFASIQPDMVCLSKSLSGYGLPFSLLLFKPQWDQWKPGEDNGTFRGNTSAFVTAKAALENYWSDDQLSQHVFRQEKVVQQWLQEITARFPRFIKQTRGRGLFYGIELYSPELAQKITQHCFGQQLIVERSGDRDQVIKIMPALSIPEETLLSGLVILERAMEACLTDAEAIPSATRADALHHVGVTQ